MPIEMPRRVETERLILRPWEIEDAPLLKAAVDESLEHLRAWMPWAMDEPSPLEVVEQRIAMFASARIAGDAWPYGLVSRADGRVIGGAGLHQRIGPGALEIGYWVHVAQTRRGYATEAARALTATAFTAPEIERVEIRCDPHNIVSAAIPRRLGYRHVQTLENDTVTPAGGPRDTMIWELTRAELSWTR